MPRDYSIWHGKPRQSLQIPEMLKANGDSDDCLEWHYKTNDAGYGIVRCGDGVERRVHRVAFALANPDAFDPSLNILHSCDNPPCFNPKHLSQGTQAENLDDMTKKGRRHIPPSIPNQFTAGELNGNARLDASTVRCIRGRFAAGEKQVSIARSMNISVASISLIVRRLAWKHVD